MTYNVFGGTLSFTQSINQPRFRPVKWTLEGVVYHVLYQPHQFAFEVNNYVWNSAQHIENTSDRSSHHLRCDVLAGIC